MPRTRRAIAAALVMCLILMTAASTFIGGGSGYVHYQSNATSYIPDLPGGAQYVSMGDSYATSGSHRKVQAMDLCTRNGDDLGHVLAQRLQPYSFTDRACAGATLDDLTQPSPKPNTSPQLYGVGPYTRLVTVLAGANSMGFGGVVMHCFAEPDEQCRAVSEQNLPGTQGWAFVRAQYAATVDAIRKAAAPDVRIVLVGYLPLFTLSGPENAACLDSAGIPAENVDHWRRWYRGMEQLIAEVAADRGALYIAPPTERPACSPDPYVALGGVKLKEQEPEANGLHPTLAGQRAVGNLIEDRLRGIDRPA
ncbi:SGNH/GDSL hydrolase family protein [Tsukamurella strandjordii]|uniref:SGNH/GDSL hydrolase family protein n=1 Tax=Tsukamurella strandjordii TaxID=147577 RepID=A0AA90NGE6_9ACTN|nr:SGNH/GDSL hydrolase family protein [Tsukamurella strandjordii]MDP0397856.1 SGNH/GDSL hydrolase family protein [Tsukamurella strandjordii]